MTKRMAWKYTEHFNEYFCLKLLFKTTFPELILPVIFLINAKSIWESLNECFFHDRNLNSKTKNQKYFDYEGNEV